MTTRIGLIGAAWGTVGAMTLLSLMRTIECQVIVQINPFQMKLLKPLAAFVLIAALLYSLKPVLYPLHTMVTLIVAAGITVTGYLILIVLFRLDEDDWEVIRSAKQLIKRS